MCMNPQFKSKLFSHYNSGENKGIKDSNEINREDLTNERKV
jgi:hypothetical protein